MRARYKLLIIFLSIFIIFPIISVYGIDIPKQYVSGMIDKEIDRFTFGLVKGDAITTDRMQNISFIKTMLRKSKKESIDEIIYMYSGIQNKKYTEIKINKKYSLIKIASINNILYNTKPRGLYVLNNQENTNVGYVFLEPFIIKDEFENDPALLQIKSLKKNENYLSGKLMTPPKSIFSFYEIEHNNYIERYGLYNNFIILAGFYPKELDKQLEEQIIQELNITSKDIYVYLHEIFYKTTEKEAQKYLKNYLEKTYKKRFNDEYFDREYDEDFNNNHHKHKNQNHHGKDKNCK